MAEILDPNYETVSARCEHCGELCIFSRVDDLKTSMPVAGSRVTCDSCRREFWINGDVINTSYQFLIDDAKDHFRMKRHMPAIASLGQAWEVFFAAFAMSRYVFHPFFATPENERDIDDLNRLNEELRSATQKFTFVPMRNLLLNSVIRNIGPQNVAEASTAIDRIEGDRLGNDPATDAFATIADDGLRQDLSALRELKIATLRNNVVHKRAYRPSRSEVEPCLREEIRLLYRVKHKLKVRDFIEHQMDAA